MTENHKSLRLIIYGTGAVGGVLGGHLVRAGSDVIFIARPSQVNILREQGLRLITPTGTHTLPVSAVSAPDQIDFRPDDVIFLCVKSQDTDDALRNLHTVVDDMPIFCYQNGVRNEEIAARYFPRIYGVAVRQFSVYIKAGEVMARNHPPGWAVMGRYPKGTDELVEAVAAKLRTAGFHVLVTPEIMPYNWGKLISNLTNVIGAITNDVRDNAGPIAKAVQEEAEEILTQAGIRWISDQAVAKELPEGPIVLGTLKHEAQSSTWQSLAKHVGNVETDFFNGEIVRLARRLGRQAPLNEALLNIAQEMAAKHESPGKYTLTELRRLLELDTENRGES